MGKWKRMVQTGVVERIDFETDRLAYLECIQDSMETMRDNTSDPINKFYAESWINFHAEELTQLTLTNENLFSIIE